MSRHWQSKQTTTVTTYDPRTPRKFWLEGNSVMCACPDCRAPMTIRLWLLIADCWQCGCSVELTAAQERQIQSMLRTDQAERSQRTNDSRTSTTTVKESESAPRAPSGPQKRLEPEWSRRERPRSNAMLSGRPLATALPVPMQLRAQPVQQRVRNWLGQTPAWLISLLFHMALLALLALLFFENDASLEDFYITLSTEANRMHREGGEMQFTDLRDSVQFDMPIPESEEPAQRAAIARAIQDAKQLRIDPSAVSPELPSLGQVKQKLRVGTVSQRTFAARDPRVRGELVTREGGTTLTEAAVARGLRWMAQHQNADGSWSLDRFHRTESCRGRCGGHGHVKCDSAGTSLCLLPFLGAGQTHQTGIYRQVVSKGLKWLIDHQTRDGDLRDGVHSNAGMYAHGQGAIVLCEAFAMTREEELRTAAQRAIDFIVKSQHREGGWRYQPGQRGDTSVLGWQLMAMQSARAAELDVPIETWELANLYLDSVQSHDGSRYAYQPNHRATHVMTAEALLCRMYLGWDDDFAPLHQGVQFLLRQHMPHRGRDNFYYWYYATQVMHHVGGKSWNTWNLKMRDILVDSQVRKGHAAGSWDPHGGHATQGGRLYTTALAVCTLEVYYRHAPIFRQIDL